MLECGEGYVAVVNEDDQYQGTITLGDLLRVVREDSNGRNIVNWLLVPLLLIVAGLIITIYVVNNPTDSMVARALTYANIIKRCGNTLC